MFGCRKQETQTPFNESEAEDEFFSYPSTLDVDVKGFAEEMQKQNNQYHFLQYFIENNGYINWTNYKKSADGQNALAVLPFSLKLQNETNGFIICHRTNGTFTFQLYRKDLINTYRQTAMNSDSLTAGEVHSILTCQNLENFNITESDYTGIPALPESLQGKNPANFHLRYKVSNKKGSDISNLVQTCITYTDETEWWYNPNGDACNCDGDEYYSYSTYDYQTVCYESGGGGGGGAGGTTTGVAWWQPTTTGGGGGGTGTSSPPRGQTPCTYIANLAKNTDYSSHFNQLKPKTTSQRFESGFTTSPTSTGSSWTPINGSVGTASIEISVTTPVSGFIHSHYTGLLSIFSPDDLRDIAILDKANMISSVESFTIGVTTASNTSYVVMIEDLTKFRAFANSSFADDQTAGIFGLLYESFYGISPSNTPAQNELNFLKLLKAANTGLKVFKANSDFTYYSGLSVNANGTEMIDDCP